ncbi:MAG: rhodanese-like domain-containing protein [Ferruginibacter sp.]|nr:rhodanese-like domain-containing protein [Ferruginibacter sp.]
MKFISPEELKARLDAGEAVNLLDVRELEEHEIFSIGGRTLSVDEIYAMHIEDIEDWKEMEVVCYCRSGNRSMRAALMLETIGFTQVKNLQGGMVAWKERYDPDTTV